MAGSRNDMSLERTSSQMSTASRKSGTVRVRSRKQSLVTPTSAKTLESFPSLSPDISPSALKQDKQLVASPKPKSPLETPRRSSKTSPSTVESLITSTPSFRGRSALFEDLPKSPPNEIPGSLHHASDDHVRKLVKKTGVVTLVRQLAEDLAARDAEMTALRRRAEERERELKKMLREVEVSNLEIETRLHRLENSAENKMKLQDPPLRADGKKSGQMNGMDKMAAVTNGIDGMMVEAMQDYVGPETELDEGYLDSRNEVDRQATLKARSVLSKESDGRSTVSSMDSGRPNSTLRGWKDYIWSANATSHKTSRASSVSDRNGDGEETMRARALSGSNARRKALDDDLFQPLARASTTQSSDANQSRKSSTSVASWTLKLFGGNTHAGQGTIKGRSATTGNGLPKTARTASSTSGPAPTSAKAALMKVNSMEPATRSSRKATQPLTLAQSNTLQVTSQPSTSQTPVSPNAVDDSANLGPVEMDTIHPADSKPPTLTQLNNYKDTEDLLTDRFGFIYDQRRRKRETESTRSHTRGKSNASANVELLSGTLESLKNKDPDQISQRSKPSSVQRPDTPASVFDDKTDEKPAKRWQDYLKVATFPTELLSHTPSAKPATKVTSADNPGTLKRSPTVGDARGSLPSTSLNPEPEMSPVTAGNAEMSKTLVDPSSAIATSTSSESDPVKLLLAQLTEVHDSLQREKTVKWNGFLRKVRAERKKEGETAAGSDPRSRQVVMPEMLLTDGELIGVAGLGNKGKVGRAKWKEFRQLVLGGIPVAYRSKIWAECSGATALRVPGYYDDLVASELDDPVIVSQIQMDIHRTLTDNVFFRKGPGATKLNEVLLAYSRRNPQVGYCQGMNLITASLLLVMPTAEDAFWLLTTIIENVLPQHYYDHSLLASRADQQVLRQYVAEVLPKLSAHLDDLGIELEALTFQWFLSVFTDCLSAEALFRVWDVIFCFNDGSTFLFQLALALLKLNESQLLECDSAGRIYGYIGNEMTDHAISIDGLIGASEALKKVVQRSEVEERRYRAVEEERNREKGRMRGSSGASEALSSGGQLSIQEPRPFFEGDETTN
ncbi:hypothetical protein IMSHALPRED_006793 [Imshaugia aleurites]|uniref:Rab-GAP TBC domain-containing protein n=1 Tax=Imshaugia aleurites TaxID=172621 RepID=A0A8H3ISH7_9LECA|nr:hypothetical protein IMSHALPRED_006793 [Imshaugia aleurites]